MFIGEVHYAKGIFYGVVVDDSSVGKNNGKHFSKNEFLLYHFIFINDLTFIVSTSLLNYLQYWMM